MRASGSKQEITDRIAVFLETGDIQKPSRKTKQSHPKALQEELSLETVISEHHRCSQAVRAFFKSVIPNFHFSIYKTILKRIAVKRIGRLSTPGTRSISV